MDANERELIDGFLPPGKPGSHAADPDSGGPRETPEPLYLKEIVSRGVAENAE